MFRIALKVIGTLIGLLGVSLLKPRMLRWVE